MIDRFSRWVEAVPTKGPDGRSADKSLFREVFPRFGLPDTINSDHRAAFVVDKIKIAQMILGIKLRIGCA